MVNSAVVTVSGLVVGLVIGGAVVFGVMRLTERSSDKEHSSTMNTPGTRATSSLRLVIVVSRHGNRGGLSDYPGDPYPLNKTEYWPYGPGALTPVGRIQAYRLGLKLRSLYNGFLPPIFHPDDIYASSDNSERVIMTGQTVLAGLYPPRDWQVWDKNINWQPVPLYTDSIDRTLFINSCPVLKPLQSKYANQVLESEANSISEMIDYVYKHTQLNISASLLNTMFDQMNCERTEGLTFPAWAESLLAGRLKDFFLKLFKAEYMAEDEMVRLITGELFNDLVGFMENKVNGSMTPDRKMVYVSGHDTTVMSLQVALGVPRSSLKIVHTGSAVTIELHQNTTSGQYSVQVLYIDGYSTDLEPVPQSLPRCGDPCMFQEFLTTTQNFTNVNWQEECQISNFNTY